MSWNSMLNECIKLKNDFINNFGMIEEMDFKYMINTMKNMELCFIYLN